MNNTTSADNFTTCESCNATFYGVIMINLKMNRLRVLLCPDCWKALGKIFTDPANKKAMKAIRNT